MKNALKTDFANNLLKTKLIENYKIILKVFRPIILENLIFWWFWVHAQNIAHGARNQNLKR